MASAPRYQELWTIGGITETVTAGLSPDLQYFAQTYLVQKDGSQYAHAYIAQICRQTSPDQILCEVPDDEPSASSFAFIANGFSVTFGLRTKSGAAARSGTLVWLLS